MGFKTLCGPEVFGCEVQKNWHRTPRFTCDSQTTEHENFSLRCAKTCQSHCIMGVKSLNKSPYPTNWAQYSLEICPWMSQDFCPGTRQIFTVTTVVHIQNLWKLLRKLHCNLYHVQLDVSPAEKLNAKINVEVPHLCLLVKPLVSPKPTLIWSTGEYMFIKSPGSAGWHHQTLELGLN